MCVCVCVCGQPLPRDSTQGDSECAVVVRDRYTGVVRVMDAAEETHVAVAAAADTELRGLSVCHVCVWLLCSTTTFERFLNLQNWGIEWI